MCPRGRPRGQGRPLGLHLWKLRKPQLVVVVQIFIIYRPVIG